MSEPEPVKVEEGGGDNGISVSACQSPADVESAETSKSFDFDDADDEDAFANLKVETKECEDESAVQQVDQ